MKIAEVVQKPFPTPFDDFDFSVDFTQRGGYIRDRLLEIQNRFGELVEKASVAEYKAKNAEIRLEMAIDLASSIIEEKYAGNREYPATRKKAMISTCEIKIPGDSEATTPYREEQRYTALYYIAQRGKDKVKEINSVLDLGRSILSWDRSEIERLER